MKKLTEGVDKGYKQVRYAIFQKAELLQKVTKQDISQQQKKMERKVRQLRSNPDRLRSK